MIADIDDEKLSVIEFSKETHTMLLIGLQLSYSAECTALLGCDLNHNIRNMTITLDTGKTGFTSSVYHCLML